MSNKHEALEKLLFELGKAPKIRQLEKSKMKIKIKKLHPDAVIPKYANPGDAGMDLTAVTMKELDSIFTHYGFGLALEIPEGFVGLVFPRSSCYKQVQILTNSVGVIDSGYRGEISAVFAGYTRHTPKNYIPGDRVAQLIIMPVPSIEFEEVNELSETERGTGGYGSTGK